MRLEFCNALYNRRHHQRCSALSPVNAESSDGDVHSTMRPHLSSSPPDALAFSALARRVRVRHPGPPDAVWACSQLFADDSLPTAAPEDSVRLTSVRFSSVGRGPTSATEPSVQLDLESGTICRWTSVN